MAKVAFVTGGNGISGSALVEHLARKTLPTQWSKIIVTSLSPLQTTVNDPRITFLQLDFLQNPIELADVMREPCAAVTHAFFSSYAHRDNFSALNAANDTLFSNFLTALLAVIPNLENVTLQTGGKHYNLHLHPIPSPARESDPRTGSPAINFYHAQEDLLLARQRGQRWGWTVIRPEAIIGTTPKPNGMNSALTLAVYFQLCAALDLEARMPTNATYWHGDETVTDAGLLADFTLWASTFSSPSSPTRNQAFNCVNPDVFAWNAMWPRLAAYFRARTTTGSGFERAPWTSGELLAFPLDDEQQRRGFPTSQIFRFADWARDKRSAWHTLCEAKGVPGARETFDAATWEFQDWVFARTWNATLSMEKARACGWRQKGDRAGDYSYASWVRAFERLRGEGQIP